MVSSSEKATKAHLPNCHVALFFVNVGIPLRVNAQIRLGSNQGKSVEMKLNFRVRSSYLDRNLPRNGETDVACEIGSSGHCCLLVSFEHMSFLRREMDL